MKLRAIYIHQKTAHASNICSTGLLQPTHTHTQKTGRNWYDARFCLFHIKQHTHSVHIYKVTVFTLHIFPHKLNCFHFYLHFYSRMLCQYGNFPILCSFFFFSRMTVDDTGNQQTNISLSLQNKTNKKIKIQ